MAALTLLTPNWRKSQSILPTDTTRPPISFPIEWAYLAGQIPDCIVIDAYAEDQEIASTVNLIRCTGPRLVLLSSTPSYLFWRCPPLDIDLLARYAAPIQALGIPVVVVGPHGTSDPAWTLKRTQAQYVFRGEVEAIFPFDQIEVALSTAGAVPGLCSSNRLTPAAPEPSRLYRASYISMQRPYPVHTWLPEMAKQFADVSGALIEAARGCAWDCAFCFRGGFRNKLRIKDIKVLAAELDELLHKGVRYVFFIDETFGAPWQHYSRVLDLICERGFMYGIQTRPDIWVLDRIARLRDSGCVYAEIGLEATRREHLEKLGKFYDVERTFEGVNCFRSLIPFVGVNVFDFGIPELQLLGETKTNSIRDPSGMRPLAFVPYPDTPMGKKALKSIDVDGPPWEIAKALHILFSFENRFGLSRMFRRWRWLRRFFVMVVMRFKMRGSAIRLRQTRFERRMAAGYDKK